LRAQLTGVDLDLLRQEHRGLSTKEIARELRLSAHGIDNKFRRLSARLGVSNRRAAAALAATYGLI
jgi:DNA-binding NarL/FixJ family response regulator